MRLSLQLERLFGHDYSCERLDLIEVSIPSASLHYCRCGLYLHPFWVSAASEHMFLLPCLG